MTSVATRKNHLHRTTCLLGLLAMLPPTHISAAEPLRLEHWRMDGQPVYAYLREPASGPSHFNKVLAEYKKRGSLNACRIFVEMPLTRVETLYGGLCTLDEGRRTTEVQVCNDAALGEFGMEPALQGIEPKAALIQFIFDHCGGG